MRCLAGERKRRGLGGGGGRRGRGAIEEEEVEDEGGNKTLKMKEIEVKLVADLADGGSRGTRMDGRFIRSEKWRNEQ